MTPEQRVTAAIDCTPYAKATPDASTKPRQPPGRLSGAGVLLW